MLSFGKDGWIKYGWTTHLNNEKKFGDNFYIKFSPRPNNLPIRPALDTAVESVKKISQTYPPPYNLMCSGGTDSQAMIYSWLKSDIPFNIISIKYVSDNTWWNQHDLTTLEEFSYIHNLKIDYKDFDIINFLENDLDYVAKRYECPSPHISTYIKMTDLVSSGTIIFSGNYIHKERCVGLTPAILGLHKFSLYKDRADISVIPFFFLEFPELAYAFTDISTVSKEEGYAKHGFPVISQNAKITGFEKLKDLYDKYQSRVPAIDRLKFSNKQSKRVFDLIFRYPYEGSKNYHVVQLTCKE
jgi:hypothetical protein